MAEQLEQLRSQLDILNMEILELLNRRATIVEEIGHVKSERGMAIYDPVREKEQLERIVAANTGPFSHETIRHLFKQIFQASAGLQQEEKEQKFLVSRKTRKASTIVELAHGIAIGGGQQHIVAGPCSVETPEQMEAVGHVLQRHGIRIMRGGAYKPRTSPYDFQGLGVPGLQLLRETADRFGLIAISEIVSPADVEMACDYLDVIQVGARNMQNFELLKAVGSIRKPVLLKRGLSGTIEEFMMAAEYILSRGNDQIILCERGIRTYEKATRNTLDISAVPILKQETHLPVMVDITHSTGRRDIILPMAKAALAVGADGIMLEVHPEPSVALSDAKQQLDFDQFAAFMEGLRSSGLLAGSHLTSSVAR